MGESRGRGRGRRLFLRQGKSLVLGCRRGDGGGKGGSGRTGFSFAVEGGEGAERGDEDAEVGERDQEGKPVHGCPAFWVGC